MFRLMLLAVAVLGCNYYGPDNPPPPDAEPVYRYRRVEVRDPGGVAVAQCPAGSFAVAGGGDCVDCSPSSTNAYIYGSNYGQPANPSFGVGCFPGCARAVVYCLTSDTPGTVTQSVTAPDPYMEALRARRAALEGR